MRYEDASTEAAWFHLSREVMNPTVAVRFCIDGEPMSKARPRFAKGRTYTPEATVRAQAAIAAAFKAAAPDYTIEPERTYGVTALFFHATRQRRDVDNMIKLILDGLNGVAWEDDVQVVEVSGRKCLEIPDDARTEVLIYKLGMLQHLTAKCAGCGQSFRVYPGNKRLYCSRDCVYAHRRSRDRPRCKVCGNSVNDRRNDTCSVACAATAKSKPRPRCVSCAAPVSDYRKRLCRGCYLAAGVGRYHVTPECDELRHDACDVCACPCHLDTQKDI